MGRNASSRLISMVIFCVSLAACTEPGQMTGIGAATGGVVGAGLGAIVGNQTGNAGSGLAIGAVAGAGAGAAVGNVLEAQDQAIRQQDEAIERQEQVIRAQRGELDQLRRLSQDSVRFRGKAPTRTAAPRSVQATSSESLVLKNLPSKPSAPGSFASRSLPSAPAAAPYAGRAAPASVSQDSITSRNLPKKSEPVDEPQLENFDATSGEDLTGDAAVAGAKEAGGTLIDSDIGTDAVVSDASVPANDALPAKDEAIKDPLPVAAGNTKSSADCLSAETEFQQAAGKSENPDKLFHIRRALRLCPDDARFHSSLGDIYSALGRGSDARFEFQEALRLSPGNAEVRKKLEALPGDAAEQY